MAEIQRTTEGNDVVFRCVPCDKELIRVEARDLNRFTGEEFVVTNAIQSHVHAK